VLDIDMPGLDGLAAAAAAPPAPLRGIPGAGKRTGSGPGNGARSRLTGFRYPAGGVPGFKQMTSPVIASGFKRLSKLP
jgi:hypothetical protein